MNNFDRLKVDPAQTGFFEGREFRTFREFNLATSETLVIKTVVPLNIILFSLELVLDDGWMRLSTHVGGTEGGTFAETLPKFGTNNMSLGENHRSYAGVPYASAVTITAGGTHTGGTTLDVLRIKTANGNNFGASVGAQPTSERGIAIGTYYFQLQNLNAGATTGVFRARWEERP